MCAPEDLPHAIDGDNTSIWACNPSASATVTIDLGEPRDVGRVVHGLGRQSNLVPRMLQIETSEDGVTWRDAWSGRPLEEAIGAGLTTPVDLRIVTGFERRRARFVRLSAVPADRDLPWLIAELEIWSGRDAIR